MALATTKDIETQGNLGGHKIEMSLDENSLKHLMSVLSDLYSDPAAAVIREYITNAIDSHIASGQTRPVEVTGPSRLDQYFKVQDFGLGLNTADIESIYSKFGASTKRETDTQTGMLGLGSKSALTFTEQFTITAIKDGIKNWTVVSRSADGAGHMEVVSTTETDEPNGVTIKVPVNGYFDDFNRKMFDFVKFITPGLVKCNGNETADWRHTFTQIDEGFYVENAGWSARDVVVMGNVAYPIDRDKFDRVLSDIRMVAHIPMSSVDFTPSREELMYTTLTKATIEDTIKTFREKFQAYVSSSLDKMDLFHEAYNESRKIFSKFSSTDVSLLTWKEHEFNRYSEYIPVIEVFRQKVSLTNTNLRSFDPEKVFVVTNFGGQRMSMFQYEKLEKHLEDEFEAKIGDFMVINRNRPEDEADIEFVDRLLEDVEEDRFLDWKVIRKIKIEDSNYMPVRKKARTYDGYVYAADGSVVEVEDHTPDATKPIYFASKTTMNKSNPCSYHLMGADDQFFWVTPSVEDTFLKRYPKAKSFVPFLEERVREYVDGLTPEDLEMFRKPKKISNTDALNYKDVLDPELLALSDSSSGTTNGDFHALAGKMRDAWNKLPYSTREDIKFPQVTHYDSDLAKRYPLLAEGYFYHNVTWSTVKEHLTAYVNMIYTNINKENSAV